MTVFNTALEAIIFAILQQEEKHEMGWEERKTLLNQGIRSKEHIQLD